MAVQTRRTWPLLRDEAILCAGGHNHTNWSGRVEYWMYYAFLDLCFTYHFHELETTSNPAPSDGDLSLALPADCFIVVSLSSVAPATQSGVGQSRQLTEDRAQSILARRGQRKGMWERYSRYGSALIFDKPLDINLLTPLTLHYYKRPAAIDFGDSSAGNVPVTPWEWDDHIVDATVAKIQGKVWTYDQAQQTRQTLAEWLAQQTQPRLIDEPMNNPADMPTANKPQGGSKG